MPFHFRPGRSDLSYLSLSTGSLYPQKPRSNKTKQMVTLVRPESRLFTLPLVTIVATECNILHSGGQEWTDTYLGLYHYDTQHRWGIFCTECVYVCVCVWGGGDTYRTYSIKLRGVY